MHFPTRGDLIVVPRDHDARSGPCAYRVEGFDEGLDRDGAPGVPKVPEERDAGVPRFRLAMHSLEDVDADARGAAVEVEVGEDDPSADARVIGAERVVREDVHGRAGCGGDGWVRGGIGIGAGPASRGFFPARHRRGVVARGSVRRGARRGRGSDDDRPAAASLPSLEAARAAGRKVGGRGERDARTTQGPPDGANRR